MPILDAVMKPGVATVAGLIGGIGGGAFIGSADLDVIAKVAVTLREYGNDAFTAFCLLGIIVLYRALRQAEQEKFELAMTISPLADRLSTMLMSAARKRRSSSPSQPGGPDGTV